MKKINYFTKSLAFFVFIFLFSNANLFAQNADKSPDGKVINSAKVSISPKVTQVDEVTIKDLLKPNGKPLLINFWATWCIPCREEFPDLVELDKKFKGKIDFITISLDDPAEIDRDVPKFLAEMKAEMPTYLLRTPDENAVIASISKDWAGGLPFTVLYNEKGELIHFKQGKIKLDVVKEKINDIIGLEQTKSVILSLPQPKTRSSKEGKEDAKNDIANGNLRIKRYGLTVAIPQESLDKMKKEYSIEVIDNGCILFNTSADYFISYNETKKAEITKRFGVKILKNLPL